MSSAYKHAMLQAFCVPVAQVQDADASSHRLKRDGAHQREPVEGWPMWTSSIIDIIQSCATREALERLQNRQRPLLKAISREQPDHYAQVGAAFAKRAAALNGEQCANSEKGADGEESAISTRPENGEACAKNARRRPPKSAPQRPKKRAKDASVAAPGPA